MSRYFLSLGIFLSLAAASSVASAGMGGDLLDENGNVKLVFQGRCDPVMRLTPESCARNRVLAEHDGCINHYELQVAAEKGFMVMCKRDEPEKIMVACPCSCFRPDVRIWTTDRPENQSWVPVDQLVAGDRVASLTEQSRLPDLWFQSKRIDYTVSGPETTDLYVVRVDGLRPLAITEHHAFLKFDGKVTTAAKLRAGDQIVGADGAMAKIASIGREKSYSDVINFLVDSKQTNGHFVVAEGLVVGDLLWQNMHDADVQAVSLR